LGIIIFRPVRIRSRLTRTYTIKKDYAASPGESFTLSIPETFEKASLYIKVDGATDISLSISPDGGSTIYDLGVVSSFTAAGDDAHLIEHIFNWIKIVTSLGVTLTLQLRGIV